MKNAISKLGVIVLALAASVILADVLPPEDAAGAFVGKIESVDVSHRSLGVKGATSSMTFMVATDAKISGADKKELAFADLKIGDEVTVNYTRDNGVAVAHTITLKETSPPPAPPPADKPVPL